MNKKSFRIICYTRGDETLYETKVKTWIGWISFAVFYKTYILHIFSDPSRQKSVAYDRIYQYGRVKGYKEKDIVISEIDETKEGRGFL